MTISREDNRNLEGQHIAREYIQLLKDWIPRRKSTIEQLRNIANELDDIEKDANIGKLGGTVTVVLSSLAAFFSFIASAGLATPFIVGGLVAGTVALTSELVGDLRSRGKVEDAQKVFDNEKEILRNIEEKKERLDNVVAEISRERQMKVEDVTNMLLMATVPVNLCHRTAVPSLLNFSKLVKNSRIGSRFGRRVLQTAMLDTVSPIGKGLSKAFTDISLKGVSRIAGTVLKRVTFGLLFIWEVVNLVETISDISDGSRSKTAVGLRDIARELQKQVVEIEELLDTLKKQVTDLEVEIREQFHKLLLAVSAQGDATDDDKDDMEYYIKTYACDEWIKSSIGTGLDMDTFARNNTFPLARIVANLETAIRHYNKENDEEDKDVQDITVISHGSINTSITFPCHFYYMTRNMDNIRLYEPWGCSIDASVGYGIVTNTIEIENVSYSGKVLKYKDGKFYPKLSEWNDLPRDSSPIPTLTLCPVVEGEAVYNELMKIIMCSYKQSDGIIVPYFNDVKNQENNLLHYPNIPLCVFTAAVAICGIILKKTFKLRVCACLYDPVGKGFVECEQYFVVERRNPVVMMTNNGLVPE